MLVLGVDPGTLHLGWGLVEQTRRTPRFVACGVIEPSAKLALADRLVVLDAGLRAVLERHAPAASAVESLFFHKDAQAAAKLGHARGVVLLRLASAGLVVGEYPPATVKRTVAGNGRASKPQVAEMVRVVLGLDLLPQADAADALAVALTHARLGAPSLPQRGDSGADDAVTEGAARRALRALVQGAGAGSKKVRVRF